MRLQSAFRQVGGALSLRRGAAPRARVRLPGLVLLALLAAAGACDEWSGRVRIGFSGPLTGLSSDLGVQGRNGATLAVEELNAAGGVDGRQVELLVADETDEPAGAPVAIRELEQRGAAVVVGLMSSAAASTGLREAAALGLAVISPTASDTSLSGLDDVFFRVTSDARVNACELVRQATRRDGDTEFLLFLDQGNQAFVQSFSQAFADCLVRQGGRVAGMVALTDQGLPDGPLLARQARDMGADAVLAVCSPRSLANLVRELRPAAPDLRIYSSFWGFTPEFLDMAGAAAEGAVACLPCPLDAVGTGIADFDVRFRRRFGFAPSFAAVLSYEAVLVAARGLEKTGGRRQGMVQALASLGQVPGLAGDIALDRFGDVIRTTQCVQVRQGRILALENGDE